jgi:hypothetical protein
MYLRLLLALLWVSPSPAATLWSQPPKLNAPTGWAVSSPDHLFSTVSGSFRAHDNFRLSTSATITDVAWWGVHSLPSDRFEISIYTGVSQPVDMLYRQSVTPSTTTWTRNFPSTMQFHTVSLPIPFLAAANTDYWLSIFNNYSYGVGWGWVRSQDGDGAFQRSISGRADHVIANDLAFELSEIPEPSIFSQILLGLSALIALASLTRLRLR